MRITVTQDDIDLGTPVDIHNCALTRAIRRATGNPHARMVTQDVRFDLDPDAPGTYVLVSPEVIQFRRDFDGQLPVQPFEFDLDIPTPSSSPFSPTA